MQGRSRRILAAALEPATGERVELEEVFSAYAGACQLEGKRTVPPGQFVDPLRKFCKAAGIRIKDDGGQVYLMNVRLAEHAASTPGPKTAKATPLPKTRNAAKPAPAAKSAS
jgi:hypothetical protein